MARKQQLLSRPPTLLLRFLLGQKLRQPSKLFSVLLQEILEKLSSVSYVLLSRIRLREFDAGDRDIGFSALATDLKQVRTALQSSVKKLKPGFVQKWLNGASYFDTHGCTSLFCWLRQAQCPPICLERLAPFCSARENFSRRVRSLPGNSEAVADLESWVYPVS
ncbi:MAG TPA: hypothetical protein ENJ30_12570 [Desulfobulbaceae bacterium]|nr:hypothetical protein [Desulfobulbaceae bacterium]